MISVLSTKQLSTAQKNLLLQSGLGLVQYDAIKREALTFKLPKAPFDALIFTSQFAINHFFTVQRPEEFTEKAVFCVGQKSKMALENLKLNVVATAKNAKELGALIIKSHQQKTYLFCSGESRREELPRLLKNNNIRYKELVIYKTHLNQKSFRQEFDGILFFSPSGVESFVQNNQFNSATAFCIGQTTAKAATKYTDKIIIASKQTIENVIVQAAKYFESRLRGNDQTQVYL